MESEYLTPYKKNAQSKKDWAHFKINHDKFIEYFYGNVRLPLTAFKALILPPVTILPDRLLR